MVDVAKVKRAMAGVFITSMILLIPSVLIWIVNLEIAIQSLSPDWSLFSKLIPAGVFQKLSPFAADYSTVTTFVPLLIFLFPLISSFMVLRRAGDDEPLAAMPWLPYPHRFGFFLVMLGLTGTLYGLLIGMSTSGINTLTGETSAESISDSLERLLNGTATALLSSLAGLAGAFVAAEPFTWVFRHLAGVVEEEDEVALSETLEILTNDLMELSKASREVRALIVPEKAQGLYDVLNHLDESVRNVLGGITSVNDKLSEISEAQQAANESLLLLKKLETMDVSASATLEKLNALSDISSTSRSIDSRIDGLGNCLLSIKERTEKNNDLMLQLVTEMKTQGAARKDELNNILAALSLNNSDMKKDRDAIRKAFVLYGSAE